LGIQYQSLSRTVGNVRVCAIALKEETNVSRVKGVLLIICVVAMPALLGSGAPTAHDQCQAIEQTLKRIEGLKPGDFRSQLEQSFELDGGLQFPTKSRYVFKTCRYIKIDVELSNEGIQTRTDFLPSDRIVRISKPYLEYPVSD
jgi:hypothetical protein